MESGLPSKDFKHLPLEKMWKHLFYAIANQKVQFVYMSAGVVLSLNFAHSL
jgi:hypothetical protein